MSSRASEDQIKTSGGSKPAGRGNDQRHTSGGDAQKSNSSENGRNNKKFRKNNFSNNYLLRPPTSMDPGNIGQWKRRITADLKEKANKLACFIETGKILIMTIKN